MKNKNLNEFSNEEIADAFIIPRSLTKKQYSSAAIELAEARKKRQQLMTADEKLRARLLQLRLQMEDYVTNQAFDTEKTFGYFLKNYLLLVNKKRNEFAGEIDIHQTLLSNIINDRREPSDTIIIRLEIHSNNTIPAINWLRLAEKKKEYFIKTNRNLRKTEKQFVTGKVRVAI